MTTTFNVQTSTMPYLKSRIPNSKGMYKSAKSIKISQWNKGSAPFINRKEDIIGIIIAQQPHILFISEANIGKNAHIPSLQIDNYKMEIDNKRSMGKRSNAVMYIKQGIKYKRRKVLEHDNLSSIWIEIITTKGKNILLNGAYREWSEQLDSGKTNKEGKTQKNQLARLTKLTNSWTAAALEEKQMIVIGDWNLDTLVWTSPQNNFTTHNTNNKPQLELFIQSATTSNLSLLTNRASRYQGKDKPSALDVILSNSPGIIDNIYFQNANSDHLVITCSVRMYAPSLSTQTRRVRSYKNYSKIECQQMATEIDTEYIRISEDPEYISNCLTKIITDILDVIAPYRTITPRVHYAPYLTLETKQAMKKRDELKKVANISQLNEDKILYKKARNKTTQESRKDKKEWLKSQMTTSINSGKKLWQAANKVMGRKSNNAVQEITLEGKSYSDRRKIAEILNQNFINKVLKIQAKLSKPERPYSHILAKKPELLPNMSLMEISKPKLDQLVSQLKNSCFSD